MQRVDSMHTASGTSTDQGQVGLAERQSPMDAQLARVVAHLAQTNPDALPAVLSALGANPAGKEISEGSGPVSASKSSTTSALPSHVAHPTPAPAAVEGSFYTEGTLLNPPNPVRGNNAQRADLQAAGNIRASWVAARGRRKSAFGRATPNTTPVAEYKLSEGEQTVEKTLPVRLSKDHDLPLKNQPPGGLMYVPAAHILVDHAPWTDTKLEALHKLCRKMALVGYPVFTYGMTAADIRQEVEKSLPSIEFLSVEEYVSWIVASDDGKDLYKGPRSTATGGRHLDHFYQDGGVSMVAHLWPSFATDNEKIYKRFLREWEDILDDLNQPQGRQRASKALKGQKTHRASRDEVAASPANAKQALRRRLPITVLSATSAALAPVDEEAVAAAPSPAWGSLGRPLALSESSADEDDVLSDHGLINRILGPEPPARVQTPLPGAQEGPGEPSTPTPKARKTPKMKRARIECSPLFSNGREIMPRLTRNSARAGIVDNTGDAVA